MKLDTYIGTKMKNLRNQNGLTQQELADRAELTKGFISQVERGLTIPSLATLADIVECLGSNLSDFFNDKTQTILDNDPLTEKIYQLNEEQRAALLAFLNTLLK